MTSKTQDQRLLGKLAWSFGLLVVLVGCVWSPLLWLKHRQDDANELRFALQAKQQELNQGLSPRPGGRGGAVVRVPGRGMARGGGPGVLPQ